MAVKQAQNRGLLGTVMKRWHAVLDEKTCCICEKLHNKTIGIDEKFTYWKKGVLLPINSSLKDPDSHLAPPAHLFCRCWLEFKGISPPDPKKLFDEIKELLFDKIKDLLDKQIMLKPLQNDERYDTIIEMPVDTDNSLTLEQVKQIMTKQVVQSLPKEQKRALQDYTGFDATQINTAIRQHQVTPEI